MYKANGDGSEDNKDVEYRRKNQVKWYWRQICHYRHVISSCGTIPQQAKLKQEIH